MASKLKLTELLYPTSTTPAITINADDTVTFGAPTTTITNLSATSITDSGNLTFTGTGNRIRGEFSTTTISNRVAFQTSTVNGNTVITTIPNGTGSVAGFLGTSSSTDPNNSSEALFAVVGGSDLRIQAGIRGTGTYLPMTFLTGGSEAMRITTDRNVGIGTISPNVGLTVSAKAVSAGYVVSNVDIAFPSAYSNGFFRAVGNYQVGSGVGGTIQLGGKSYSDSGINAAFLISAVSESNATDALTFSTQTSFNNVVSERMRLDSSGNLLVGTTTYADNAKAIISFTGGSSASRGLVMVSGSTASTAMIAFKNPNGYAQGEILTSGSTTSYNTSSDYRLKENVAPMTGALEKVAQLKPCTYKWKADGSDGQGFIAHELQAVVSDCVTGEKDAVDAEGNPQYQGVDTSFLVATLVAAIQELKSEFDAYKLSHP